jgi:Tol biopolymer transport system component
MDLLQLATQPKIQETGWRCDFHPRWHPNEQKICFDSAHSGRRQICVLDVKEQVSTLLSHP